MSGTVLPSTTKHGRQVSVKGNIIQIGKNNINRFLSCAFITSSRNDWSTKRSHIQPSLSFFLSWSLYILFPHISSLSTKFLLLPLNQAPKTIHPGLFFFFFFSSISSHPQTQNIHFLHYHTYITLYAHVKTKQQKKSFMRERFFILFFLVGGGNHLHYFLLGDLILCICNSKPGFGFFFSFLFLCNCTQIRG